MKKTTVLGVLALAILVSTALPLLATPTAQPAAPAPVPAWLAGLVAAPAAGPGFLPHPVELTACSQTDRQACTIDCRQNCQAGGCRYNGSTCTVENGCVCDPCLCP